MRTTMTIHTHKPTQPRPIARIYMTLIHMALIQVFVFTPFLTFAKNTTVRKVQEVNFAEMDLKGTVRNPDGAYLVQKRGIKFMPLYDMQKNMDGKIRDSIVYAK